MENEVRQELLSILQKEVKPALGCTGPIGICYGSAEAYDAVRGGKIKKITAKVDWGFGCKNDDIAFPGTKMLGAEMAVALGALCGDPKLGMEVLKNVDPALEVEARKVAELVEIIPQWDKTTLGLFIDVTIETDIGTGRAVVMERSDGLVLKERDGVAIEEREADPPAQSATAPILKYGIADFYEFAKTTDEKDLSLMADAVAKNTRLAMETINNRLGAGIGATLYETADGNTMQKAKAYAAAGCEARMSGVNHPAMTCGNKGNVGIAASMPLVSLAEDLKLPESELMRAVAFSYLTAISVITRLGKSPAMCSCEVAASLGIAAGSVFLQGGTLEMAQNAIQMTIPNIFGVVCDGAKLACAMRISSGTGVAMEAANLALKGVRLANNQGVLAETADKSIDLMGYTSLYAMVDSDRGLCKKLFEKRNIFPLMSFEERQKQ